MVFPIANNYNKITHSKNNWNNLIDSCITNAEPIE